MAIPTLTEIVRQWQLSADEAHRLAAGGPSSIAECLDIDRALLWLLGDRAAVCRWMRARHQAFYHCTPLQLVLGSDHGRQVVRRTLLAEAADAHDPSARAAAIDP